MATMTGLEAFDATLHKTHVWLRDIMEDLRLADRQKAYLARRGALHGLRDRLTLEEAVHLGAQLPLLVRGIYFEGWRADRKAREAEPGGVPPPGRTGPPQRSRHRPRADDASRLPVPWAAHQRGGGEGRQAAPSRDLSELWGKG